MMMRRQHGSRRRSGESGAALVLVLVLVTVVGVIAAAAIRYAGTSMTASAAFQTRRNQQADAEAAIRTAVQYVKANEQSGGTLAADGTTCPTNFSYPGGTGTVTVAMCPQPGSLTYAGYFRATLLTLAPSGFGILQTKNTTLNVNGNVWSDSYVSVRSLNVTGNLSAWNDTALGGNCTSGSVVVTGTKDCNAKTTYNNVVPQAGIDPGDPSLGHASDWAPAAAPGAVRTPSSCNLVPGVYTSGSTMTIATNGTAVLDGQGNSNAVWIFQIASSLTTGVGSNVVLTNGAKAANVFWIIGASSTIGGGASFKGTALARTSNTVGTAAVVEGRLVCTDGAISLLSDTITLPAP